MWFRKVVLTLWSLVSMVTGQVIVGTDYGPVEGHIVPDVFNGEFTTDVVSFLGVPYGADTSGQNRFALPKEPEPWDMFVADSYGDQCPQGGNSDGTSEDCLNVNIYTPVNPGPHPVMVWFHGGAYTGGSNRIYPGHFMATRNVVMVVVNYRLGHFGFAYTASAAAPGNFGLHDQNLALQFVQNNIASFGGDPNKVTIFGQSAGAGSSGLLMMSPLSQGRFQQVILESGTETNFWSMNYPEAEPEGFIWQVAEKLNCSEGRDDFEMIDCLRQLPWELVRATRFDCTPGHFCQGMGPVVDGPGGFMPQHPSLYRESGDFAQVPMISCITRDDGAFYTMGMIPESMFGGFNRSEFLDLLENRLLAIWEPMLDNITSSNFLEAVKYNYSPWPYIEDEYDNRNAFNEMITDFAFGHPWNNGLNHHHQFNPNTYGCIYDYRGRNGTQVYPEWMGVMHAAELPQTWGWSFMPLNDAVRNDSGMVDILHWTDEDRRQSQYVQALYSNFAHTGDPTSTPVEAPSGGVTNWRPFSGEDMAFLYITNVTQEMGTEWRQRDYAFWREYMNYIAGDYPLPIRGTDGEHMEVEVSTDVKPIPSDWLDDNFEVMRDLYSLTDEYSSSFF